MILNMSELLPESCMYMRAAFLMRSPVQRKYAVKAARGARRVVEKGIPLLDCVRAPADGRPAC